MKKNWTLVLLSLGFLTAALAANAGHGRRSGGYYGHSGSGCGIGYPASGYRGFGFTYRGSYGSGYSSPYSGYHRYYGSRDYVPYGYPYAYPSWRPDRYDWYPADESCFDCGVATPAQTGNPPPALDPSIPTPVEPTPRQPAPQPVPDIDEPPAPPK